MLSSHTNDISLRFKTPKRDSLLFTTSNEETADYLNVSLDNGRGKLSTNLGGSKKVGVFGCCRIFFMDLAEYFLSSLMVDSDQIAVGY